MSKADELDEILTESISPPAGESGSITPEGSEVDTLGKILDELGVSYHNDYPDNKALKEAKQAINQLLVEEYLKGYNNNARDCNCDKFSIKPHHHLLDDGKSYHLKPDLHPTPKKSKSR